VPVCEKAQDRLRYAQARAAARTTVHVHKALALLETPLATAVCLRDHSPIHLAQASEAVDNARQARGGKTVLVL
jgi:hypothetical protein